MSEAFVSKTLPLQQLDNDNQPWNILPGISKVSCLYLIWHDSPFFPPRCASVHSVGPSGLLLRHPDFPIRFEPLQQKPDRAPSPRGGLRHGRGARQPGQYGTLECAEGLRPQPCPRQDPSYLRASVQRSRYVKPAMSPDRLGAAQLISFNCGCKRLDMKLRPQDRIDRRRWVTATVWQMMLDHSGNPHILTRSYKITMLIKDAASHISSFSFLLILLYRLFLFSQTMNIRYL